MKYIAYYRVSTQRQGQSGLGLDAQKHTVQSYIVTKSGDLLAEYTETESGKKIKNRPQLAAALEACKQQKATLLISRIDRLARNLAFVANLIESKVSFISLDNPECDIFMTQQLALLAEWEGRQISKRTKEALAAAKARGVELGKHGKILAQQGHERSEAFAAQMKPIIFRLFAEGLVTYQAIADGLTRLGIPTAKGNQIWSASSVHIMIKRFNISTENIAWIV